MKPGLHRKAPGTTILHDRVSETGWIQFYFRKLPINSIIQANVPGKTGTRSYQPCGTILVALTPGTLVQTGIRDRMKKLLGHIPSFSLKSSGGLICSSKNLWKLNWSSFGFFGSGSFPNPRPAPGVFLGGAWQTALRFLPNSWIESLSLLSQAISSARVSRDVVSIQRSCSPLLSRFKSKFSPSVKFNQLNAYVSEYIPYQYQVEDCAQRWRKYLHLDLKNPSFENQKSTWSQVHL